MITNSNLTTNPNCSMQVFGTPINELPFAATKIKTYEEALLNHSNFFNLPESPLREIASKVELPLLNDSQQNALSHWFSLYTFYIPNKNGLYKYFPNGRRFDRAFSDFKKIVERLTDVTNDLWKSFFKYTFPEICREHSVDPYLNSQNFSAVQESLNRERKTIQTINETEDRKKRCDLIDDYSIGKQLVDIHSTEFETLQKIFKIIASDENIFKPNLFNTPCDKKIVSFQNPYSEFFDDVKATIVDVHDLFSLQREILNVCHVSDENESACLEDQPLQIEKMNETHKGEMDEKKEELNPSILWVLYAMTPIALTIFCALGLKKCRDRMNRNQSVTGPDQGEETVSLSNVDLSVLPKDMNSEAYFA